MLLLRRFALAGLMVLFAVVTALYARPGQVKGAPETGKDLRPVASTGTGTLKGSIRMKERPKGIADQDRQIKEAIARKEEKDHCLSEKAPAEQKGQQTWLLGKDDGLASVFVWLAPPKGHYFKIDLKDKTWPEKVVIDQPYCAFVPHAAVLFPSVYNPDNPGEPVATGQQLIIRNSAPINHNTAWKGGPDNPGDNKIIPGARRDHVYEIHAEANPDADPVYLHCDIHPWMKGVVRAFDHPYATVTDKDGHYEIKHAPAGADLLLMVWHDGYGYVTRERGDPIKLKAGETTTKDFQLKAP